MAGENEIIVPHTLGDNLPTEGNIKVDISKSQPPSNSDQLDYGNLTDAEKLLLAEKQIKLKEEQANLSKETKEKEEREKKEKEVKIKKDKGELTDEEKVQLRMKELSEKKEEELTDEEKQFITDNTPNELSEIQEIQKNLEETYGVKLSEKEYDNGPDGLKEMANDLMPVLAEQMFLNYLETVPYMKDFFDHVAINGRSIETFISRNEKPMFESIEIKPIDQVEEADKPKMIANLKSVISMDLSSKGVDEDAIKSLLDVYEAGGQLYDKAKTHKENLIKAHKANVDARIKAEEDAITQQQQAAQQEIKMMKDMITKNNFNGLQIPTTDIKAFTDAMFRPIDARGNTAMDLRREKLSLAERGLIDYLVFKGFKVSGIGGKKIDKASDFSKLRKENNTRGGNRLGGGGGGESEGKINGGAGIDIRTFITQKQNT